MRISDWSSDVCSSDLEGDVAEILALVVFPAGPPYDPEPLPVARAADGNDETTTDRKLAAQRRRNLRAAGGHDDRVEGRMLRPAARTIAVQDMDVVETQAPEPKIGRAHV